MSSKEFEKLASKAKVFYFKRNLGIAIDPQVYNHWIDQNNADSSRKLVVNADGVSEIGKKPSITSNTQQRNATAKIASANASASSNASLNHIGVPSGFADARAVVNDNSSVPVNDNSTPTVAVIDAALYVESEQPEESKSLTYDELVELIISGKPIPGIKKIPNIILQDQLSKPVLKQRKKPWEIAREEEKQQLMGFGFGNQNISKDIR